MSDKIATALVGLTCTVIGMFLGWYLKEFSRARKERSDKYHEELLSMRSTLETALQVSRRLGYVDSNSQMAYLTALGRLEPYADRLGQKDFQTLKSIFAHEFTSDQSYDLRMLDKALRTINYQISKSSIF